MASPDVEKVDLHVPTLQELAIVLQTGLEKNFADVHVSVVDCPDLRQEPFTLVAEGIGGRPRVLDVGGVPYLMPNVRRDKIYNMDNLAKLAELPGAFLIGAGAGPHHTVGVNCELMANIRTQSGPQADKNGSYVSLVSEDNSCKLSQLSETSRDCALMVNLLASEGKPDKVLQVKAGRRTGRESYVDAMRFALKEHYGDEHIGIGGTFAITQGKARMHVMPDFAKEPLLTEAAVNNWLRFYDMSSPLICLGVFYSHDPGYDLRIEHFHGFSHHGEGGHYHHDTTPDHVQYLGYFTVAEYLYRIDRPQTGKKDI